MAMGYESDILNRHPPDMVKWHLCFNFTKIFTNQNFWLDDWIYNNIDIFALYGDSYCGQYNVMLQHGNKQININDDENVMHMCLNNTWIRYIIQMTTRFDICLPTADVCIYACSAALAVEGNEDPRSCSSWINGYRWVPCWKTSKIVIAGMTSPKPGSPQ